MAENTSSNISDGLISETESGDYEDYGNVDSNEDFKSNHNQLSNLWNNQFVKTNDQISNSDRGSTFNEQNHTVNHINQPMINQLHHQRKSQSHLQENQLSRLLDANSVQGNNQLNQEAYQLVNKQIIQQQNSLFNQPTVNQFTQQQNGLLHHPISNQTNNGLNQAVNQFQEKTFNQHTINDLVRNLLSKQSIQLDQTPNNPLLNHFSQEHNSLLSQLVHHQKGNQFNHQGGHGNEQHSKGNQLNAQLYLTGNHFTPNEQPNGQLSHITDQPTGHQFPHQQTDSLKHALNNLVGSQFIQQQNAHTNELANHFSNPVRSQFTHQPNNQLISHVISQLTDTKNLVKQPNQLIQTPSNQWTQQTDEISQQVNQLIMSEVPHNDLSNKPASQLKDKMKHLMNLFALTADSQIPEQQNDPSNKLANMLIHPESNQISQQNVEISLPTTQSIHPARMKLILQQYDQGMHFTNTASSQSPQEQNIKTNIPTVHLNHSTTTAFMKPSGTVQLNQLAHIVSDLMSHRQNAQTNENQIQGHTGSNLLVPQKNSQFNHIISNQFTLPQDTRFSRSMSQLANTVNDQATHVTYNESNKPTDVIINYAEDYISNSSKVNGTENNLMQSIHNQLTNQKTQQINQLGNKLNQPTTNAVGNSYNTCTNQLSGNVTFCEYKSKVTDPAVNRTKHQAHKIEMFLPDNHTMLPVINEFNNTPSNRSVHRENSKFDNHKKNMFPYATQNKTVTHETSQRQN